MWLKSNQQKYLFDVILTTSSYWNSSWRADCLVLDDSQGIQLYSLGGVFISTAVGLVIAMVVLAAEVMYYRRREEQDARIFSSSRVTPESRIIKVNQKTVNLHH